MGIYIQDLEMPKAGTWLTIRIYPDGKCVFPIWQGDCNINKDAKAIAVSNHPYVPAKVTLSTDPKWG